MDLSLLSLRLLESGAVMDPCTLEEIFIDYKGRRAAILKALVVDFDNFYKQCDPNRVELYLYAYSDENWKLTDSPDDVDGLPLPPWGHNKIRDDMSMREWANNICIRSQAWLIEVVFYFAGKHDIQQAGREELFKLINALPTLKQEIAKIVLPAGVDSNTSSSNITNSEKVASSSNVEDCCPVCDKGERKKHTF